jgi:adenylate kinase
MNSHIVILVGRAGSGKGTQGQFIKEFFDARFPNQKTFYISTGTKFREFVDSGTYSAELSKKINSVGELQPEFLAVWNWSRILIDSVVEDGNVIFDGSPRKLEEAKMMDSAVKFYNWQKPLVIEIDVDNEEAVKRLMLRKREDDTELAIRERLSWYDRDVVPMIEWYKQNKDYTYINIPGVRSVEEIKADIAEYLASHLK